VGRINGDGMKEKKSQLQSSALITYFAIAINIVAGLIYTPWIIEQIGKNDYGLYILVNSLIALFMMDFGLSSATARYIAKYRAENKQEELEKFLNIVYRLYIIIDAIILIALIVVFFFLEAIYKNLTPEELHKFRIIYCIAGAYSILSFPCVTFNGILNAYEEFLPLKIADVIQKVSYIFFTFFALYCGMGLYVLVTVNAISGLIAILIKFYYVKKNISIKGIKIKTDERKEYFRKIFSFSLWSTIWALSQRLIFNITPTLLGVVVVNATITISIFGIITTIEGYFHTITTALNGMFLSRITRMLKKDKNPKEFNALAVNVGRFQVGLSGLLVVGFIFAGKDFIKLWVGEGFIDAYYGIILIIIPGVFYNALQILHTAIVVQNLVKYQAYIQIFIGVINVVCSLILSRIWGVLGASMSICIAYCLRLILTIFFIKKKMEFDFINFLKKCYLKMSFPIVASFAINLLIVTNYTSLTWGTLVIKMAIITLVYLICVCGLGLSRCERKLLLKKIKRKEVKV
jgi:O-antigen/teichoic acid export membrane protein